MKSLLELLGLFATMIVLWMILVITAPFWVALGVVMIAGLIALAGMWLAQWVLKLFR